MVHQNVSSISTTGNQEIAFDIIWSFQLNLQWFNETIFANMLLDILLYFMPLTLLLTSENKLVIWHKMCFLAFWQCHAGIAINICCASESKRLVEFWLFSKVGPRFLSLQRASEELRCQFKTVQEKTGDDMQRKPFFKFYQTCPLKEKAVEQWLQGARAI